MGLIVQTSNWRIMFYKGFIILKFYLPFLLSLGARECPDSFQCPTTGSYSCPYPCVILSSLISSCNCRVYLLYRNLIDLLFLRFRINCIFGVLAILMVRIAPWMKRYKKIVALSTLSQLGLIVLRLAENEY